MATAMARSSEAERTFGSGISLIFGPAHAEALSRPEYAQALKALHAAGLPRLDMARAYGHPAPGHGEADMGAALAELPADVKESMVVSTKMIGMEITVPVRTISLSADSVQKQLEIGLSLLGVQQVDCWFIHQPDLISGVVLEETLSGIDACYKRKMFRRWGLSNFPAWGVMQAFYKCKEMGYVLPSCYQGIYNPITRQLEQEVIPCCRRLGMIFHAYSPLAGGILTDSGGRHSVESYGGKGVGRTSEPAVLAEAASYIKRACAVEGIPIAQAAQRWCLHHSALVEGDGIISNPTTLERTIGNIAELDELDHPLPSPLLAAFEHAWNKIIAGPPGQPNLHSMPVANL